MTIGSATREEVRSALLATFGEALDGAPWPDGTSGSLRAHVGRDGPLLVVWFAGDHVLSIELDSYECVDSPSLTAPAVVEILRSPLLASWRAGSRPSFVLAGSVGEARFEYLGEDVITDARTDDWLARLPRRS